MKNKNTLVLFETIKHQTKDGVWHNNIERYIYDAEKDELKKVSKLKMFWYHKILKGMLNKVINKEQILIIIENSKEACKWYAVNERIRKSV